MKTNHETFWEIINDFFSFIMYLTLSKNEKIEANLNLIKGKYWYKILIVKQPQIISILEEDKEIRKCFFSRWEVRKLLNNPVKRKEFVTLLENKINS